MKTFRLIPWLLAAGCLIAATLLLFALNGCADSSDSDTESAFIINEIMPANHAGLLSEDGVAYDWIEIKNISNETASLGRYSLRIEKTGNEDSEGGKKKKPKEWQFPDIDVAPGGYIVVFASKKGKKKDTDDNEATTELHTNFRLSSKGGKLQLKKRDAVVSEVSYGPLDDDQCYRRLNDGTFEASYEPTPGYDNTSEGYESYNTLLEKQRSSALKLWEVHTKGYKSGNAWIEVRNVSDKPLALLGYALTTSKKDGAKWDFPAAELQPGEVFVVDCKKEHFKVGKSKSIILLKDDQFADGIAAAAAPFGVSTGRVDGKDGFFFIPSPTRGKADAAKHYRHIATPPSFTPAPGVYAGKKSLNIVLDTHGHTVRYTNDGTLPTASSHIYSDSIIINKTTTIRAYSEGDSTTLRSAVVTATFILADAHTLPVMNITVAPSDLYDFHHGIYVAGPGAGTEYPYNGANYWKSWWKKAHVEFFDSIGGGFSSACELAIFGGFSRTLNKKSFKIKFSDGQGQPLLEYDLYGMGKAEEHKNFVLRSGSQDYTGVMVRDEFFTSLMKPHCPTLLIQAYRPVVLYVNGEYFGIYYIREKIDKRFVARHLGVSSDSISIIMSGMYCEEGTKTDFSALLSYATSHDLAKKECYEYVKSRFDLVGLIDFKLGQMYSCNTDLGNVRYVRSTDPKGDKKWHIVYYDLDATWVANKPFATYFRAGEGSDRVTRIQNILVQELLKNTDFRQLLLERLSLHMHKTFSTANATAVFDQLIATIKPEMQRNCARWPQMTYSKWESHVAAFRAKFKDRNRMMMQELRQGLSITDEENKKYFADLGF